jgi:hypothetical protein
MNIDLIVGVIIAISALCICAHWNPIKFTHANSTFPFLSLTSYTSACCTDGEVYNRLFYFCRLTAQQRSPQCVCMNSAIRQCRLLNCQWFHTNLWRTVVRFSARSQICEIYLVMSVCSSACNNSAPIGWIFMTFDMDMSNGRGVFTVRCKIWRVRCKILHQRTLIVTNDVMRPLLCARITCYVSYNTRLLLCARITCYVTVITHAHCYARS